MLYENRISMHAKKILEPGLFIFYVSTNNSRDTRSVIKIL